MNRTDPLPSPALPPSATTPRRDADRDARLAANAYPTVGEMLDDVLPLIGVVFVAGPPVIFVAAPWLLLGLMLSGPFALLVAFMAVTVVAAVVLATLVALVATPFILVRRIHRTRRTSPAVTVPGARVPSLKSHQVAA